MRISILTPSALPSVTGNAITAERWRRSLSEKGCAVQVLPTQKLGVGEILKEVLRFQPDLVHVHHALRAGALFLNSRVAQECGRIPLVVSPAGTDINGDLRSRKNKETILGAFRLARVIIAQGQAIAERLAEAAPEFGGRTVAVPKSICWLGRRAFDIRRTLGWGAGEFLFFLPAGIRPVKGNLECLEYLREVHAARPEVRVVFAGPSLDADYFARFESLVRRNGHFARWIPLIPPACMRAAYGGSDVVLNTSFSEGLSNALLEGMAAGRPVLASDIGGNRTAVTGKNGYPPSGCLFDPNDPEDFKQKALRLVDDKGFREALGEEGRRRAAEWPTPAQEAEALILAYRMAVCTGEE